MLYGQMPVSLQLCKDQPHHLQNMFYNLHNITNLDLAALKTDKVKSMKNILIEQKE